MPNLSVRKPSEVPPPHRTSKAVAEAQQQYEGYIQSINGDVGELELDPEENLRSVKVRLRRAASRAGKELQIWDADGRVYFQVTTKLGRPRKAAQAG